MCVHHKYTTRPSCKTPCGHSPGRRQHNYTTEHLYSCTTSSQLETPRVQEQPCSHSGSRDREVGRRPELEPCTYRRGKMAHARRLGRARAALRFAPVRWRKVACRFVAHCREANRTQRSYNCKRKFGRVDLVPARWLGGGHGRPLIGERGRRGGRRWRRPPPVPIISIISI